MKEFLLGGAIVVASSSLAMAADMAPAPADDWTGFYLGLNGGVAINNSKIDQGGFSGDLPPDLAKQLEDSIQSHQTVFTGGGEMGYNWQVSSVVLGLEADFNYLGFDGSRSFSRNVVGLGTVTSQLNLQTDWFGTVRGRLGFAADNFLLYGTGGLAYGRVQADGRISDDVGDSWKGAASTTDWGWTIGAGAEYALDQNWIVGAEYLYVDLGSTDFNINSNFANHVNEKANGNVNAAFSVVRATVKYKF